jgi:hypothetical protein
MDDVPVLSAIMLDERLKPDIYPSSGGFDRHRRGCRETTTWGYSDPGSTEHFEDTIPLRLLHRQQVSVAGKGYRPLFPVAPWRDRNVVQINVHTDLRAVTQHRQCANHTAIADVFSCPAQTGFRQQRQQFPLLPEPLRRRAGAGIPKRLAILNVDCHHQMVIWLRIKAGDQSLTNPVDHRRGKVRPPTLPTVVKRTPARKGAAALDLVVEALHTNRTGLPEHPKEVLIKGTRCDRPVATS